MKYSHWTGTHGSFLLLGDSLNSLTNKITPQPENSQVRFLVYNKVTGQFLKNPEHDNRKEGFK